MTATAPVADPLDLFESHKHLGISTALRLRSRYQQCTLDELENAALCGVWKAAQTWDGQTQFRTWAIGLARWAVLDYAIYARPEGRNQCHLPVPRFCSLSRLHWHAVDGRADRAVEILDARDECAALLRRLSSVDGATLRDYYLDGLTLREIGQRAGIGEAGAHHRLKVATRRARELFREGA